MDTFFHSQSSIATLKPCGVQAFAPAAPGAIGVPGRVGYPGRYLLSESTSTPAPTIRTPAT